MSPCRFPLLCADRRARARIAALALTATLAVAACSADGSDTRTATVFADSAGVTLALHEGRDRPAPFAFDEQFRLGGSETRPEESFYRVHPSTVGVDYTGNLHVLDAANYKVVTFDADGRFVRSVGRQGGGPGELGIPAALVVLGDGSIGVVDFARRGLVRFDTAGETLPIQPLPLNYFGGHVHASAAALTLPAQLVTDGAPRSEVLIRVSGADTTVLVTMPVTDSKAVEFPSCGMSFSGMPPIFAPTLRWAAANGRTAVVTGAEYDVRIYEGDDEVRRVRRAIAPQPATLELAIAELGDGLSVRTEGGVRVCEPREVAERRGVAPVIPAIARVALAPDGTLVVERGGVRDAPKPIDFFDVDGAYLGTLPPGSPFPVAYLPDARIAAGVTDEFDVMRLVVYAVRGAQPSAMR